jgi:hypothetical protein
VILAVVVLIAALAVATYEMRRRRAPATRERDPLETADPPPHIYGKDDTDADGGDGGE